LRLRKVEANVLVTRFINDSRNTGKASNVKLERVFLAEGYHLMVVTCKEIFQGEELLLDYSATNLLPLQNTITSTITSPVELSSSSLSTDGDETESGSEKENIPSKNGSEEEEDISSSDGGEESDYERDPSSNLRHTPQSLPSDLILSMEFPAQSPRPSNNQEEQLQQQSIHLNTNTNSAFLHNTNNNNSNNLTSTTTNNTSTSLVPPTKNTARMPESLRNAIRNRILNNNNNNQAISNPLTVQTNISPSLSPITPSPPSAPSYSLPSYEASKVKTSSNPLSVCPSFPHRLVFLS
jgi:hypothetical protein